MIDPDSLFSPLVEQAIELSAQWHDATYRKGRWRDAAFEPPVNEVLQVPVMAHVTAVALTVQRAGWHDAVVAAAFLHDVIEDGNRWGQTLRYEELGVLMGQEVADLVQDVTEDKLEEDGGQPRSWLARKEDYVLHLRAAQDGAVGISLADKLHNLWSMNESLERGVDIFTTTKHRRGLSAGPDRQLWFHHAVLDAGSRHDDPRLIPQRHRLQREIERFETLIAGHPLRKTG